jgi:hypothetical protein
VSGIFISYRREETAPYARRLRDRLVQEFGQDQVFMGIDAIALGVDFVKAIEEAVAAVDVLICVMGPEWSTITDESGKRRLDDPNDFIRLEVATALKRDIQVIPVLVKRATLPSAGAGVEPEGVQALVLSASAVAIYASFLKSHIKILNEVEDRTGLKLLTGLGTRNRRWLLKLRSVMWPINEGYRG